MDNTVALLLALVLLGGNAFFVAAEFALVSARRSSIEPQALKGSRRAKVTLKAMENVSLMMAGAQLGITVCSLGLGALGEPAVAYFLEAPLASAGISHDLLHPISFAIALMLMTFLHVVLGEMVPKNITLAGPERSALLLSPSLRFIVQMLKPVIVGLNATANGTLRLFGIKPKAEVASAFTRDEVAGLVEESHREGLLTEEKEQLLAGTLQFDTRFARNIVIKMEDLVTIHVDTPLALAEDLVSRTGYSRLPVLREGNKFEGYVHIKDILNVPLSQHRKPLPKKAIRTLVEIYENDTLRTVLRTMQKAGTHMAVVKNEQGSSIGVATLEDAIEELVGEIRDASQKAV